MAAACSGHPARISQLLLHPHPGMKHPLGAVRIAAALSPSQSSLMERLKNKTMNHILSAFFRMRSSIQSVLLMSLGSTPLFRAKHLPVQDSAAFSSLRTESNNINIQHKSRNFIFLK